MVNDEKPLPGISKTIDVEGDENPERGNWTGKLDFLLSCLGYAVGLGNVWRFPYLCYKHGGGAFLIPYVIMLVFVGLPTFFLELALGQYSAMGPTVVYTNLAPLFKGLGIANFLASAFVGLYYNMIIGWTIYYLFASFTSQLPWDRCDNDFNSEFCFNTNAFANCTKWRNETNNPNIIYHNGTCIYKEQDLLMIRSNLSHFYGCTRKIPIYVDDNDICKGVARYDEKPGIFINEADCADPADASIQNLFDIPFSIRKTGAEEYLYKSVLQTTDGIDDMGTVKWHLALCLLAAWLVIFFALIKGVKSSGKVVYFTATFPYAMLVVLLIRAVTLPGAYEGIKFYMVPDWSKLSDIKVWEGAAIQIFFSLSLSGGGLITLASYNKFHNNIIRDTFIVCIGNCLTSVFAGFAIFSVLGFLAHDLGVGVEDVVQSGTGLAFIAYPDLVTRLPISPLWSILFFAMLFTLGLDSEFAIIETVVTGTLDIFPRLRSKHLYVLGVICVIGFLCGLPLCAGGGIYVFDLLDYYAAGWPYMFIGFSELFIIGYVYGFENFLNDVAHITNKRPGMWLKSHMTFLYMTLSPLLILFIQIASWANHVPFESGGYKYPKWADGIGWAIAMIIMGLPVLVSILLVLHKFFFEYSDTDGLVERLGKTFDDLLTPSSEWRANADRASKRDHDVKMMEGVVNMAVINEDMSRL